MAGYQTLARYYDSFFEPGYLQKLHAAYARLLHAAGVPAGARVLDAGCGTGLLSLALHKAGYDVYGLDLSENMVDTAREKAAAAGLAPERFQVADAARFALDLEFDAVVSALDVVNHILSPQDVLGVFRNVYRHLRAGGVYIFDVNTEKRFRLEYGENIYAYETDGCYCVWKNAYEPDLGVCRMDLDLFEKRGETYVRSTDALYERLYRGALLRKLLRYAGFGRIREERAERGCRKIYTAKK